MSVTSVSSQTEVPWALHWTSLCQWEQFKQRWQWNWRWLSHIQLFATPWTYTVHWILQARILEWVAISSSSGSSQFRNWPGSPAWQEDFFTSWAIREALPRHKLCKERYSEKREGHWSLPEEGSSATTPGQGALKGLKTEWGGPSSPSAEDPSHICDTSGVPYGHIPGWWVGDLECELHQRDLGCTLWWKRVLWQRYGEDKKGIWLHILCISGHSILLLSEKCGTYSLKLKHF